MVELYRLQTEAKRGLKAPNVTLQYVPTQQNNINIPRNTYEVSAMVHLHLDNGSTNFIELVTHESNYGFSEFILTLTTL
jgi:hypothetical protein